MRHTKSRIVNRTGEPMTKKVDFTINYGHNGVQVLMQFSMPVPNIMLTPQQVDDMIAGLQEAKQKLAEHIAKAPPNVRRS